MTDAQLSYEIELLKTRSRVQGWPSVMVRSWSTKAREGPLYWLSIWRKALDENLLSFCHLKIIGK